MLDRLWFRLLLGMSLALALAVGTVALLMNRATTESFADYVVDVSAARSLRVENVLTRHYQRQHGWTGVEPVVQLVADLAGQRVVVADSNGQVVADSQNRLVGYQVQPSWAGEPVIINYQEKPVGSVYLDPLRPRNRMDNRGQAFLSVVNQYLLWAAAVGLLAALILSLLLSRWLAAPLEAVTRAARRMERGDLSQTIDVRIGGEVGALAQAFNSTAASLARVERLRKQMVADIAHELRTPLTNIRGYLEAIQDGVAEPDEETLGVLSYELAQLTRLVDDLQELALAESGQLALQREDVDLGDLVARELRALQPQADARGVVLVRRLAEDVPTVSADSGRLGQAISNILRNALAHTPSGGRITAEVASENGSVVAEIRDTGAGIAPEHLPHIFERFYRGDRARTRLGAGGYGLGLTICRELVQAHGGQVLAESTPGLGTAFTIRLPLTAVGAPEPVERAPSERVAAGRPVGRFELLRTGVLVAALFGATAGLVESGLLAFGARKAQSFADIFGYAVLIDAAVFGMLGGLATGLVALLARLMRRRFDLIGQVAIWAPVGCLLVGVMAYLRWKQFYNREDTLSAPQALFAQVVIFGTAAWLALLAGAALAPRGGAARRALVFGRRLAPAALAILVGVASVGVVRDLGGRGLGLGTSIAAASPPQTSSPTGSSSLAQPPVSQPSGPVSAGGAASAASAPAAAAQQKGPNVMVVTIDTLRADHVGFTGYAKARTPTLDSLVADGVHFTNAVVNQPGTNPSHASIFTGQYPATHGIREHMVDMLSHDAPTLAETLGARGYATAAVFSWLSFEGAYSGLDRGFGVYTDLTVNRPNYLADNRASTLAATYKRLKTMLALPGAMDRQMALSEQVEEQLDGKADVTTDGVISWLKEHQSRTRTTGQPFFLWVHYFDPHYPYTPPPPFDQIEPDDCSDCLDGSMATIRKIEAELHPEFSPAQVNRLLQYYDGEIAFTDREFGRLIQNLQSMGLDQNTLIIVMGDHGESFGEHTFWLHGASLHDPEIHVPLIMRWPGKLPAGRAIDGVAQQTDIMPTVLDLLGIQMPARVEGRSLLPLVSGQESGSDRYAVAELGDRSMVSIVTRDWRLLKNTRDGAVELYRTTEDPDGLRDLADTETDVVADLERVLDAWRASHP